MNETILIVDDNADDQLLYRRTLEDFDYELIPAMSAEAGIARIVEVSSDSNRPDLILLDYNLPDMDGLSFMKRLADFLKTPVPIVILTGDASIAVAVEAMKNGADDYLVKDTEGRYLKLLPGVVGRVIAAHAQREQNRRLQYETEALLLRNQTLMQNSMDGILIMDVEGNVIEANSAFCNMLGYTREEALRLNVADWDTQWSREELRERFKSIVGRSVQLETVQRRKDTSLIQVEITSCGVEIDGKVYVYAASRDITERKKIEVALGKERDFIQAILDTAGTLIVVLDRKGHILRLNKIGEILTGYRFEEIREQPFWNIFLLENERAGVAAAFDRLSAGDIVSRYENHWRCKDGSTRLFDWHNTVLLDDKGEVEYLVGIANDITERKFSEQALRESEERWHFAIDGSGDGVWDWNLETGQIEFSERYLEMLGYSDNVNWNCLDDWKNHVAPEEMQQAMVMLEAYLDGKVPTYSAEYRMQCADGGWAWMLARGKVVSRAADGRPLRLIGTHTDITERKQSEQALRIAAATFDTHEAILITDVQGNIVRVNSAFSDITGYREDEVIGKNPRIMSSGRQDKAFYIEMWQQLLHTGSWGGEIWDKRKNGQIYPKWLTITAVKNDRQETSHYVAIFSDITARKQAEEEIRNLAFYDSLTRLPNRRLFMDRFRAALTISTRRNDFGAVLFIDLDRFKILNDTLGHDYGDLLLVDVAGRIKSCVREMDTVARLGGDEFVVLIEGVSDDQDETSRKIGLIAEKIRDTLAQPYKLKSHEHHCSPSIGISLYHGNEKPVDDLIQQADMAMYQAKESGRNAVRFFDPLMQEKVSSRASLENDLHNAILDGQMHLHYQVQMDSSRPIGAEALLRWIHPVRGIVLPSEFIPIAEEGTLILSIGHWVLDTGCHQLAKWAMNPQTSGLTLALNVSTKQFAQSNFVEQVTLLLQKHKINPALLKLELTESVVLNNLADMVIKMHELRSLGIHLSMDDFGTGYSSLSYLKDLPLDQIKIDQGFVQAITDSGSNAMLVQTIIDLAKNFSLNVIAEGVETEAQLTFLKHHDCLSYQGYLFSKPVPVEEFEVLLKQGGFS